MTESLQNEWINEKPRASQTLLITDVPRMGLPLSTWGSQEEPGGDRMPWLGILPLHLFLPVPWKRVFCL